MWAMFELYQRDCPTGQRGKMGSTGETLTPADQRTVVCVPPAPFSDSGSPWTRFATWAARVVARHAQNAPEDSVESHGGGNRGPRLGSPPCGARSKEV
jgi:hypothetical protein